ncbi:MAG: hypothetical protein NTW49_06385 [Bacteroidia bacterium]|nr:hypothetical protein [Bacteroidia bacterium]
MKSPPRYYFFFLILVVSISNVSLIYAGDMHPAGMNSGNFSDPVLNRASDYSASQEQSGFIDLSVIALINPHSGCDLVFA